MSQYVEIRFSPLKLTILTKERAESLFLDVQPMGIIQVQQTLDADDAWERIERDDGTSPPCIELPIATNPLEGFVPERKTTVRFRDSGFRRELVHMLEARIPPDASGDFSLCDTSLDLGLHDLFTFSDEEFTYLGKSWFSLVCAGYNYPPNLRVFEKEFSEAAQELQVIQAIKASFGPLRIAYSWL